MIAMIVRFRSALPDAEVLRLYRSRADRYRATPGLRQKYYLRFDTGEHGANSLRRSIGSAYHVQGEPEISTAEVVMTL